MDLLKDFIKLCYQLLQDYYWLHKLWYHPHKGEACSSTGLGKKKTIVSIVVHTTRLRDSKQQLTEWMNKCWNCFAWFHIQFHFSDSGLTVLKVLHKELLLMLSYLNCRWGTKNNLHDKWRWIPYSWHFEIVNNTSFIYFLLILDLTLLSIFLSGYKTFLTNKCSGVWNFHRFSMETSWEWPMFACIC